MFFPLTFLALCTLSVTARRIFYIPGTDCNEMRPFEIKGAVVWSTKQVYSSGRPCRITFRADDYNSYFKRTYLMLRFDQLRILNCSVKVNLYFTDRTISYDCHSNVTVLPKFDTERTVTLEVTNDRALAYDMSLILTTYRTDCRGDLRCLDGKCIDSDLRCDGIEHCFDGTDELRCYRFKTAYIGLLAVVLIIVMVMLVIGVYYYKRRSRRGARTVVTTTTSVGNYAAVPLGTGYQGYTGQNQYPGHIQSASLPVQQLGYAQPPPPYSAYGPAGAGYAPPCQTGPVILPHVYYAG